MNKLNPGVPCLVVLLAVGIADRRVSAQIVCTAPTIEWLTSSSDLIVRATVKELSIQDARPPARGTGEEWQWATVGMNRVHG